MDEPLSPINLEGDDKVLDIPVKDLKDEEYVNGNYVILCTKKGLIKKTSLEAYSRPRSNGINAGDYTRRGRVAVRSIDHR